MLLILLNVIFALAKKKKKRINQFTEQFLMFLVEILKKEKNNSYESNF